MSDVFFILASALAGFFLYQYWRSGRINSAHMWRASYTMAILALILMVFVGLMVMFVQGSL